MCNIGASEKIITASIYFYKRKKCVAGPNQKKNEAVNERLLRKAKKKKTVPVVALKYQGCIELPLLDCVCGTKHRARMHAADPNAT